MTEAKLTRAFLDECERVMPHCVALKHSDRSTSGVPDASVTWQGTTSWWEVKFFNEKPFDSPEIQEITCKKLEEQGDCSYIIYYLSDRDRLTLVVAPDQMNTWREHYTYRREGFDHTWLAHHVKHLHLENLSTPGVPNYERNS